MRQALGLLVAALLALGPVACSSDKDKGINKDKDKPRSGDKAAKSESAQRPPYSL